MISGVACPHQRFVWALPALFAVWLPGVEAQTALALHNDSWTAEVSPATLAVTVRPAGRDAVEVSSGIPAHAVDGLQMSSGAANWRWDNGQYRLSVHLDGADLEFSIQASSAATLDILRQPEAALGVGLMLPLAEGHYVPRRSIVWRDFLVERMGAIDTSQDLSLPLWGMDHGSYSLTWLFTNPFNNRLTFTKNPAGGLALSLNHHFTKLAPATPFTFILHLGGADPLAGAKRYRAWLIAEGRYQMLDAKIARTPAGRKLLGAAHIYLWGNGLIAAKDIKSWPAFLARLRTHDGLAAGLARYFDKDAQSILTNAGVAPDRYQQRVLVNAVNAALNAMARESWQPGDTDATLLARRYGETRRAVAAAFADALDNDPTAWGGTLTAATMKHLASTGLRRLWLGLGDGWEGGLWHPEAVTAAKANGYLIAPYDSYETALPAGARPDWATAHLGDRAYRECGILREDGKLQPGFQHSGYYTNPRCIRPILTARIQAIREQAGFNSWFLDSYGSGMLFDDYRPGAEMTMAQQAGENMDIAQWIARSLAAPAGSEDGNATTAGGLFFAHGMQTPVIGWGDRDLYKDKSSPYYLGSWWPEDAPAMFFKPVPMKEPYRSIYFDPTTRLPLYQAVFHGSVITTHHWSFDNLKLTNVRADNELTQLLYNVPPLYHLSASTLSQRLPIILRQDAFFRRLHEQLATQELTGFSFLSGNRLVQQTTFADGTHLIANFGEKAHRDARVSVPGHSIAALVPGQDPRTYTARPE